MWKSNIKKLFKKKVLVHPKKVLVHPKKVLVRFDVHPKKVLVHPKKVLVRHAERLNDALLNNFQIVKHDDKILNHHHRKFLFT